MFLGFLFLSRVSHKKIAKQRFIATLVYSISQLIKPTQNVILKRMGLGSCNPSERSAEGPSCQFLYTSGALGFSEKTLILKETISSLGEILYYTVYFVYYSSKENSINCRSCSTALSISPEHYVHIWHLWTSSSTAEANGNFKARSNRPCSRGWRTETGGSFIKRGSGIQWIKEMSCSID